MNFPNLEWRTDVMTRKALVALMLFLFSFKALAACTSTDQTLQPATLTHTGAADVPIGTVLDSAWTQVSTGGLTSCSPTVAKGSVAPSDTAIAGLTYTESAVSYPVYPTGVSGIGYVVSVKDGLSPTWLALNTPNVQTYPYKDTGQPATVSINTIVRIRFVVTGRLSTGSSPISAKAIAKFSGFDASGNLAGTYSINLASTAVGFQTSTCTVTNPTQTVTLPTISQSAFQGSWGTAGYTSFTISLKCQKGAHLYITMTDANYPLNTKNLLFPKGGDEGLVSVLIQKPDGSRVAFGPDSSAAGTTNQWLVGDTPDGVLNVPLMASYQRYSSSSTAVFPAGPVEVKATFTLSYQ